MEHLFKMENSINYIAPTSNNNNTPVVPNKAPTTTFKSNDDLVSALFKNEPTTTSSKSIDDLVAAMFNKTPMTPAIKEIPTRGTSSHKQKLIADAIVLSRTLQNAAASTAKRVTSIEKTIARRPKTKTPYSECIRKIEASSRSLKKHAASAA